MRRFLLLLLVIGIVNAADLHAQDAAEMLDTSLQQHVERIVEGFEGDVGVYVRHLSSGRYAAVNADTLFPTASMIKVPIMLKTFDLIERGEMDYRQNLVYRDSLLYEGHDILGAFRDGEEIELSRVIMLMITMSDNTASLWLQRLVGGGAAINEWLAEHGLEGTRVNSRTEGRSDDWRRYGWGQTTPREMSELLVMIRDGRAVSPAASERMYRILSRVFWDEVAMAEIPPHIQAMAKYGAVNRSRSETVLVNAPRGDYVFTIITKNQEDQSWEYDQNEGWELIRRLSRLFWEEFGEE